MLRHVSQLNVSADVQYAEVAHVLTGLIVEGGKTS